MAKVRSLEILDSIMSGHSLTPDEVNELIAQPVPVKEDQYLDYKHGNELKKSSARQTIRQYLSAFANSAGGILIIGIDEATWTVTGCTAPNGEDLARWASTCTTGIAAYFAPLPRFQVVDHPMGKILVAATYRSATMVPVIESGELVHYLRLHDQTLKVPDYLLNDLMLGRREHPQLDISAIGINPVSGSESIESTPTIGFTLTFAISNEGLSWAEDVRVGMISWSLGKDTQKINDRLLSYATVSAPQESQLLYNLVHHSSSSRIVHEVTIHPFAERVFRDFGNCILPILKANYRWRAAAYVLTRTSPPIWYQLDCDLVDVNVNKFFKPETRQSLIKVTQASTERPIIAFEQI